MNISSLYGRNDAASIQNGMINNRENIMEPLSSSKSTSSAFSNVLDKVTISQEAKQGHHSSYYPRNQYDPPTVGNSSVLQSSTAIQGNKSTFFSGCMDKDSTSNAVMGISAASSRAIEKTTNVTAIVKEHHRKDHEQLLDKTNYDNWLPENLAKINEIWAEMDEISAAAGNPDPSTVKDETAKQLWDCMTKVCVLAAFGETKVVTDEMMTEGVKAYKDAEVEWAYANNMQVEEWAKYEGMPKEENSILKTYMKRVFGDPEEMKEKMEEWKRKQVSEDRTAKISQPSNKKVDEDLVI